VNPTTSSFTVILRSGATKNLPTEEQKSRSFASLRMTGGKGEGMTGRKSEGMTERMDEGMTGKGAS